MLTPVVFQSLTIIFLTIKYLIIILICVVPIQSFDYNEMCQTPSMLGEHQAQRTPTGGRSRPWHDFGRQNDADKIQIPKV